MPSKLNKERALTTKQFLFAQGIIEGLNQTESARKAGYGGKNPSESYLGYIGNETIRNNKVKSLIDENKAKIAEKAEITREGQIKKLQEVEELSKAEKKYSEVIAAIKEENSLCGLIVKKTEDVTEPVKKQVSELEKQIYAEAANRINLLKARGKAG